MAEPNSQYDSAGSRPCDTQEVLSFGSRRATIERVVYALRYNPFVMLYYFWHSRRSGPPVFRTFAAVFPEARTYFDVGSGGGGYAAAGTRAGLEVFACERSRLGRLLTRLQGVTARPFDLTGDSASEPASDRVDIAYCFEVAEHVPRELSARLVDLLSQLAPLVVFSAAPPGQRGVGHINKRPGEYWVGLFAKSDMTLDASLARELADGFRMQRVASPWLAKNLMVFRRNPLTTKSR